MLLPRIAVTLLMAVPVFVLPSRAAEAPMPGLHIEPTTGGSIFTVKNSYSQPLCAFLVELVDYPGSNYSSTYDLLGAEAIPAGGEKKINVANMTVGAVPEYVKMQAAVYEDGTVVGSAEKVKHILDLRKARLTNTQEIIQRIEKDQKDGKDKDAIVADLREWATTIVPPPPPGMQPITDPAKTVKRNMIVVAAGQVNTKGLDAELSNLKNTVGQLTASKPAL